MPKQIGHLAPESAWVITEAGLAQYEANAYAIRAKIAMGAYDEWDEEDAQEVKSEMLRVEGSTGIISIKGALVNTDSIWNRAFGLVSYNSIRSALLESVSNPGIDRILLDIDSPGGAVSGVNDTAELISAIDQSIKPVFAFTDGSMASGAYWIGSSAREVYASETAIIGSIGVIMTHMEQSVRLEREGIKATVIRAGKYKQMGNPNEPLTETGEAELQSMVDSVYKIFATHVSEERSKSYEYTDTVMAQGRVFLAESAVEIGLIDKIYNFDIALAEVNAKKVDKNRFSFENNGIGAKMPNINNKKTLVSAVEAALVANGLIPANEVAADAEAVAAALAEAQATADALAAADAAAAAAAAADEGSPFIVKNEVVSDNSAVDLLKAQLKDCNESLIDAKVENKSLSTTVAALEASASGLKAIAVKSINAMQVALNHSVTSFDASSVTDVLAAHTNLSADFTKNYKVGGVAAVDPNTDTNSKPVAVDSLRAAQLAAT